MRIALALIAVLAGGCVQPPGDGGGDPDVLEVEPEEREQLETFPRDEYPPGPYGVEVLSPVADYALEGRDGPVTLSQIRRDPLRSALWIVVGAPWCPSCLSDAPVVAEIARHYEPEGLSVLPVVGTDLQGRRPDRADIDAVYPTLPSAVFDPWGTPSLTLDLAPDRVIVLPLSLVVDLDSMRIVARVTGWDEDAIRSVIERQLAP